MFSIITQLYPLFLSSFCIMLGFGLIGLLMPVRLAYEGVELDVIGLILAMYAAGLLVGGTYSRMLLGRVGHIRIFAACSALTGLSILICSLTMNEWVWALMRFVMGVSSACSYAVIDGWLGDAADNKTRGKILATSQIVITLALFSSQFLLNIAPVSQQTLFIISGIILSLSLLPVVMSHRPGPVITDMVAMSYRQLMTASPLGVACAFFSGILYGGLMNMLPIFAGSYGIDGFNLSLYMAMALLGSFLLQFPVGVLSDRFDRRKILLTLLGVNVASSLLTPVLASSDLFYPLMASTAVTAGIICCLYPMSIAEAFGRVRREEMAAAMSGILGIYAIGCMVGPFTAAFLMGRMGSDVLFYYLAGSEILLMVFVAYRMTVRAPLSHEDQEDYIPQQAAMATGSYELDPRTQYSMTEGGRSLEAKVAITMAQSNPAGAVNMVKRIVQSSPEMAEELYAALAEIDEIDITRLYDAITKAAPELNFSIAEVLASSSDEATAEFVDWITENQPEKLTRILNELAENMNAGPSIDVVDVVNEDVDEYQQNATELVTYFVENHPEQAEAIAEAVIETVPDVAEEVEEILQEADDLPS